MTGEIENGDLAVKDVADLLQPQYAIITGEYSADDRVTLCSLITFSFNNSGGKTRDGCPIITFPDNGNFQNLIDSDYQRLMLYLTSVPT